MCGPLEMQSIPHVGFPIDPAYELTMGNPTWGILCISSGPHIRNSDYIVQCAVHWRCKVFPMWDSPSSTHKRGRSAQHASHRAIERDRSAAKWEGHRATQLLSFAA